MASSVSDNTTKSVNLYPGSMGLAGLCCELLGCNHVQPGQWPGPIGLTDVLPEDIDVIIDLAKEQGVELKASETQAPGI